jgi:arabinofuranan 3-O-arabinosyltransferase
LSTTTGALRLLQSQNPTATRTISEVTIDDGTGSPRRVALTEDSLSGRGQPIPVASGAAVTITITAVADRPEGTDSGFTGVGFAELGPVASETTRLPTAALATLDGTRPLAIVMTRERTRPTDRWRSDPDAALVREFTLPVERSAQLTATLRLDRRAPDAALAALEGLTGLPSANRRLTGVPSAVAESAFDGDPSTAWTTPFGQAVGSSITVPLGVPRPEVPLPGSITIAQPVDSMHSLITAITVGVDGTDHDVVVPAPDATGSSTIDLAAAIGADAASLTYSEITITITDVAEATTIDRRFAETVELPAAITEIIGLPVAPPATTTVPACHEGLLSVDGTPVGLQFGADTVDALLRGDAAQVGVCDSAAIALAPGAHRIESSPGLSTAVDVDQVVLRSGVPAAATASGTASPAVTVQRTRTERTATVAPCPTGCWLILGEGFNPAWTATDAAGADLGAPTQIAGGFNGWWMSPSTKAQTVTMSWSPQRGLNIALLLALAGVLGCLGLAAFSRPKAPTAPTHALAPRLALFVPRTSLRSAVGAAASLLGVTALVVNPRWAMLATIPAAITIVLRRPRLLAWCSPAITAALGAWIAHRQFAYRYPADAAWTAYFEDLHRPAVFVVVLLIIGCLSSDDAPDDAPADDSVTALS